MAWAWRARAAAIDYMARGIRARLSGSMGWMRGGGGISIRRGKGRARETRTRMGRRRRRGCDGREL